MASFKESLEAQLNVNTGTASVNMADLINDLSSADTSVSLAASPETGYTQSEKYTWYNTYTDEDFSVMDNLKNLKINERQINITQENRSQVIPIELNRYWDGVDLMEMTLSIYYLNAENNAWSSTPINVSYSDTKIRFYWLIDNYVTSVKGNIKFEIQAHGVNEKGQDYVWKSRPNRDLNVLESLSELGKIEIKEDWYSGFIADVDRRVAQAQEAATEAKTASEQALNASANVDQKISDVSGTITTTVLGNIEDELSKYYTKTEVDDIITGLDVSGVEERLQNSIDSLDGLAALSITYSPTTNELGFFNGESEIEKFTLNTNPNDAWVASRDLVVDEKIKAVTDPIATDVANIKTDLTSVHANIDALPETLATDYYTKAATDDLLKSKADLTKVTTLETSVNEAVSSAATNKENIGTLGTTVAALATALEGIDNTPSLSYEATYNDQNVFELIEVEKAGTPEEQRTVKSRFTIVGGGGGSATASEIKIDYVTKSPLVATVDDKILITYRFSGKDSSGDDVSDGQYTWKIGNRVIATGTAVNGENTFDATDFVALGTQKLLLTIVDDSNSLVTKSWTVQKVDVRLESTFNDKLTYSGNVSFDYTPYGAISKNVHFVLDGVEIDTATTSASGIPMAYSIPAQTHGAHLLDVYITSTINNATIESNHIKYDILWFDVDSELPVIGCTQQNFTAKQYDTTAITYTVYDPKTETPNVTLAVDGKVVSTLVLDSNTQIWQYRSSDIGEHILTITCGDVVKTLTVNIEKLDIDIEPVTAGLAFDFNPIGKSNSDSNRLWSDVSYNMEVSDNFDWVNGGYQLDENGDQYFGIKAGTSARINYQLFADDAKRNGKEFKLVFMTENVRKADTTFLTCDDSNVGIQMNVHEAYIKASADSLYLPYSEEDIIEFEFNINKDTDIPMVMGYEDGVGTRPLIYTDSHTFTQTNPQIITIGSPDCDVRIYRFKVYNTSLTDRGILNNFIADARNADEMIARYNRNQIYNENNQLTPEVLAERCPWLRVLKLYVPHFTNNKSDKVSGGTYQQIYKNGDPILDNYTAYNIVHNGQGTTSNEYGASGRNLEINVKEEGAYFVLGDGETQTDKIQLTSTSVPTNYLNLKVNIASSENANNAIGQKRFNQFDPYISIAKQNNENVKDSMEFVNAVLFVCEYDEDLSTHREFNDTQFHYYALGNIGDSKKTDKTRTVDKNDPLEHTVEIMDNTLPNSTFSGSAESLAALEADAFDESGTYGFRYIYSKDDAEVKQNCIDAWKRFYTFVATSTDEEFKANLKDYFVVDTALYHYLFTEYYTAIDNRAKNTFWHYSKGTDGVYRYDLTWAYDIDTTCGINNSGELTMTYGYEDTDYKTKGDASTGYAYNAAESKFFCRIRDLFHDELQTMYVNLESKGAWNAESIIKEYDEWQSEFPEEIWRLDIERKYLRPYREGNARFLRQMMNGRKKYQRKQFLRDQEKYIASKYFGNTAVADQIMFRCNTPTDENLVVKPDYTLHLTPYADMYLDVMFGATYRTQIRAEAGKTYDISCPFTTMDDTAVLIYGASRIQEIGDLSACYIHDNDFSNASKLQVLVIGNGTDGYQNSFLTNLGIGNNTLLRELDIQNTPNLAQALDLSKCASLETLLAAGSGLTGVTFANGGKIANADLPASIGALSMKNLAYLENLNIAGYEKITNLVIENCPTIDLIDLLTKASNTNRIRLIGIDWTLTDDTWLEKLYAMSGIDRSGYNVQKSVLAGLVHIPVVREKKLADYNEAWPDLTVEHDSLIEQFPVTFANYDGTPLEIQYVDKGEMPVDPMLRAENPIDTPTKPSDEKFNYTFDGWDANLVQVFGSYTYTATYTSSIRTYTAKFVSKGTVLEEKQAEYGTTVFYTGDLPTYTAEEAAFRYYLFDHWDKSGYIKGDTTINAVYDSCTYSLNYFKDRELSTLRPVELYAMSKLGIESETVDIKDAITFKMGNDFNYEDIEQFEPITSEAVFAGTNYVDSGLSILEEDRDFVVAIDYKFASNAVNGGVLAQCYKSDGSIGFKLSYNSQPQIAWGTSSSPAGSSGRRDIIVLRHLKGETGLRVYKGNLPAAEISYVSLNSNKTPVATSTLVFGSAKADDGVYENFARGSVYWCKVWYADLGDEACRQLAMWTHEKITAEMYGFKRYYLSDNSGKRCSMSFMTSHVLANTMTLSTSTSNEGGYANVAAKDILNGRFYKAIPIQWRQLMKQVKIASSIGLKSTETTTSDCYVAIPAAIEVEASMNFEPYNYEGSSISYITSDSTRIRRDADGIARAYFTRSPNVSYNNYFWTVTDSGAMNGYQYGVYDCGIAIIFSI